MPKKQRKETPKQQADRFAEEVEKLIEVGALNPIDADEILDKLVATQKRG